MELEEYIKKLQGITQDGVTNAFEQIAVPEANELLANIKVRISQDGKGSNNSKLAPYSTKPMYAVRNEFVVKSAFKAEGQRGYKGEKIVMVKKGTYKVIKTKTVITKDAEGNESRKRVSLKPKSMYLPQGYKELRDIQGRRTDITNFEYTGTLLSTYQLQKKGHEIVIGFTNNKSGKVRQGLEKKRGKTFYATDEELKNYNDNVLQQTADLTKRLFEE